VENATKTVKAADVCYRSNGRVDIRKGYIDDNQVYLVSGPMSLNKILIPRNPETHFEVIFKKVY